MITYIVSPRCVSLLLRDIEEDKISETVCSCLSYCGFEQWSGIEAELFRLEKGCLLIARPKV